MKILIIQNTYFHTDTAYCIYDILKKCGHDPYISYLKNDHHAYAPEYVKNKSDEYVSFLEEKNIKIFNFFEDESTQMPSWIKKDKRSKKISLKDFSCAFIISGDCEINWNVDININFPWHKKILEKFHKKIFIINHIFSTPFLYKKQYEDLIKNQKWEFLSLCNGKNQDNASDFKDINYFYQTSNCLIQSEQDFLLPIEDEIKFAISARFDRNQRDFYYLNTILNNINYIQKNTKRKFKIYLIGERSNQIKIDSPWIEKKHNLSEKNYFLSLKNDCHFIFNFIIFNKNRPIKTENIVERKEYIEDNPYLKQGFSSSFAHSIVFQKPMIGEEQSFKYFDIPKLIYKNEKDFLETFIKAININKKDYLELVNNFKEIKTQHLLHNANTISVLLNRL